MPHALRRLPVEKKLQWRDEALSEFQSPVARLQVIGLILRTDERDAITEIAKLVSSEGLAQFDAFVQVLHWTLRDLVHYEETEKWCSASLLATAWTHAGKLFDLLSPMQPVQSLHKFFSDAVRPQATDLFNIRGEFNEDLCHPRRIQSRAFMARGLACILNSIELQELSKQTIKTLVHDLCFGDDASSKLIYPEFLILPAWLNDSMNSFLSQNLALFLSPFLDSEQAQVLDPEFICRLTESSLNVLRDSSTADSRQWGVLSGILGALPPPDFARDEIKNLLLNANFEELIFMDETVQKAAFFFIAQQGARFKNEDVYKGLEEKFENLARSLSEKNLSESEIHYYSIFLTECAHYLTTSDASARDHAKYFSQLVSKFVDAWPASAKDIWSLMVNIFSRVQAPVAFELWPLVIKLRRYS